MDWYVYLIICWFLIRQIYIDDKGWFKVVIVVVLMRLIDFGIYSIIGLRFVCLWWGMCLCIYSVMY